MASDFEFRHRMVLIAAIFALAFSCSWIDPHNAGQTLAGWLIGMGLPASGAAGRHFAFAVAAAFAAAGAALRTWGTAYLDVDTMMDARLRANRLVIAGPYRHVRNPLYLGNLLVCVGTGLLASRLGFIVLMIGMTGFLYRLIRREEQHLLRQHGDDFREFLQVPRLWPSLRPRVAATDVSMKPRWARALGGEILMWADALGIAIYAISFSVAAFVITLSVGAIAAAVRFRAASH